MKHLLRKWRGRAVILFQVTATTNATFPLLNLYDLITPDWTLKQWTTPRSFVYIVCGWQLAFPKLFIQSQMRSDPVQQNGLRRRWGGGYQVVPSCVGWGALRCCVRTRFVVLIGTRSTHAAPANKRFTSWSHDLNHMFRVSILFTIISTPFHFHSNILWRCFSDPTAICGECFVPFIPDWTDQRCLVSNIPQGSTGDARSISHSPSLTGAGRDKVSVLCLCRTSALQLSSPSGSVCCFAFNVLCLCVQEFAFLHALYEETTRNTTNDLDKWWMGVFFVFTCPFHGEQPNKGFI